MRIQISASLQCMDFSRTAEHLSVLDRWVDRFHIDVADGNYVQSLIFGPQVLHGLQELINHPIDVHIAAERPEVVIPAFLETRAAMICLHVENTSQQFFRLARDIRNAGKRLGVVLSPLTGLSSIDYVAELIDKVTVMTVDPGFSGQQFIRSMLGKIEELRELRERKQYSFDIEADGNVNENTIPDLYRSGANVMVLGSSGLFRPEIPLEESARSIRTFCENLETESK